MMSFTSYITEKKSTNPFKPKIETFVFSSGFKGMKRLLDVIASMSHKDSMKLDTMFQMIPPYLINIISKNDTYRSFIQAWNDSNNIEELPIKDTKSYVNSMILFIEDRLNRSIIIAKKSDTRRNRLNEKKIVLEFFVKHRDSLKLVFDLYNEILSIRIRLEHENPNAFSSVLTESVNSVSIVAYHGTNAKFDKFDQGKSRIPNDFYGGGVAYFTDNLEVAKTYAKSASKKSGSPHIYRVDLTLKNVFDVDKTFTGDDLTKFYTQKTMEEFARGAKLMTLGNDRYSVLAKLSKGSYNLTGDQIFKGLSSGMTQTAKARDFLKTLGYDGLRYNGGLNMNMATKHSVYLVYEASDIRILDTI